MTAVRTVLVTGGSGFIGGHLVRRLLASPAYSVVNLDALTYAGDPEGPEGAAGHPRYRFVGGDVADPAAADDAMAGAWGVVHLAAESHVDRSIAGPGPFVRTNVVGTQVILDAARRHGVERYVQASTDEVYGSLGPEGAFTEGSPLEPNSPYAASKASADLLVRAYHRTHGLPAMVTRCSNNYGPRQFPEKLIPLFITRLLADERVPVYGDGLQVRDWVHVSDHCAALEAVLLRGAPGGVYNVGGRCEVTNLALTRELLRILGRPESFIEHVADRPGHDRRYAVDCSRIERELGWRPSVPFAGGLRETAEWYAANRAWSARMLARAARGGV